MIHVLECRYAHGANGGNKTCESCMPMNMFAHLFTCQIMKFCDASIYFIKYANAS